MNDKASNLKKPKETNTETYDFKELTQHQQRELAWELMAVILVSGVLVSVIVDLFINKQLSWSKYPIAIGLACLINISLIIFAQKRLFLLLSGSFISASLLLLSLDLFDRHLGWGIELGIPLIFVTYLAGYFFSILIRKSRQKGLNRIAYFLIAAGMLCLCIEGILSLYTDQLLRLQWSLIVLVSVLPVSGILFYIHYRLKRATNLKKFFHI